MLTFARALNGAGIGLVVPILFSLVADLVKEPARGRAYGLVNFASAVGAAAGGYIATELAGIPGGVAGIEGWRFAFYLIAAIAIVLALLLLAFAREPREASAVKSVAPLSMRVVAAEAAEVLRIKSFLIILLQGAFGTAPWYALAFLTMLFELGGGRPRRRRPAWATTTTTAALAVASGAAAWVPADDRSVARRWTMPTRRRRSASRASTRRRSVSRDCEIARGFRILIDATVALAVA